MDHLNNINEIIKSSSSVVWTTLRGVWSGKSSTGPVLEKSQPLICSAVKSVDPLGRRELLLLLQASPWTRIAGLLGAAAVAMGAYGAHGLNPRKDIPVEYKSVYETANKYHFFHSLALLAVPLTRRPLIVGTLMVTGTLVFCGTCYAYALTHNDNKDLIRFTPFGGLTLILAWLAMLV